MSDGSRVYFAYVDHAGTLHVLRYDQSQAVRWNVPLGRPVHPVAFSVQEDDRNGVLVAFVSSGTMTRLEARRLDSNGATTWDINTAGGSVPLQVLLPPGQTAWIPDYWARLVQLLPDDKGGAVIVYQDWPAGRTSPKLFSFCIDAQGAAASPVQEISARATGQEYPAVTSGGGASAIVAWSDDGQANATGLDVWTQRVGCCVSSPAGLTPWPRFGCEIIQFPDLPFGQMMLVFPCGNRSRQFGVLPLLRLLTSVRGLVYPGSVTNHDAPAPDWMRFVFTALPANTRVQIFTVRGKLLGEGEAVDFPKNSNAASPITVMTFKPAAKQDQILVFTHSGKLAPQAVFPVGLHCSWGQGKPPPVTEL